MKLSILFGIFVISLLQTVQATIHIPTHYYSRVVTKARDAILLGRCKDRVTQTFYSKGYTAVNTHEKCEMVYCDLDTFKLDVKGCTRVTLNYDMHRYCFIIKGEYDQPYPYCCDQVIHKGR